LTGSGLQTEENAQIKGHQCIIPKTVSVMEGYLQDTQSVQHGKPAGRRGNYTHV